MVLIRECLLGKKQVSTSYIDVIKYTYDGVVTGAGTIGETRLFPCHYRLTPRIVVLSTHLFALVGNGLTRNI